MPIPGIEMPGYNPSAASRLGLEYGYMTDSTVSARSTGHVFRFRLRTLLVVTTLFALWLGFELDAARRQAAAVATLRDLGLAVEYDFPAWSAWARPYLPEDFLGSVISVSSPSTSSAIPAKALPALAEFPKLRSAHLVFDGAIARDDLASLAHTQIEQLTLQAPSISAGALEPLASMSSLKELDLTNTSVTPADLQWLNQRRPDLTIHH